MFVTPMEDDYPINLVHLSQQTFNDLKLQNEILSLFLNHSMNLMGSLVQCTTTGHQQDLIHSLKGSSLAIGAWRIVEEINRLEIKDKESGLLPLDCLLLEIKRVNEVIGSLIV